MALLTVPGIHTYHSRLIPVGVTGYVYMYVCIYIETQPNTNRHAHAHKCLHCAGIKPASSCATGDYSDYCAISVVCQFYWLIFLRFETRRILAIHTYIPLTLYPLRGSRGISDIPPRHPRFTKIS
jgi:hypothetical protein